MKLIIPAAIVIFVLLVGGVVAAPNYINWQKHTETLENQIAKITGMPGATVAGPIKIKTLPTPRIEIGRIEVAPYQGEKSITIIEDFETELSWRALWRLSLQPKYVSASSVEVNLVQLPEGEANYLPKRHSRRISANAPRSLYPLGAFGDVRLKNVAVNMVNQSAGTTHTFTTDEVSISGTSLADTQINLAGTLNDAPLTLNGTADLSSLRQVPVDLAFTLAESRLSLQGTAFDPFYKPMYTGQVSASFVALKNPFETLGIEIPAFILKSERLKNVAFKGNVMVNDNEVSVNEITLRLNVPENGEDTRRETFQGNILYTYSTGQDPADVDVTLDGRNIHLGQFFSALKGNGEGKGWSDAPLDTSVLGRYTFDVRFDGQNIVYGGTTYEALTMRAVNTNSSLTLEELTAEANGGTAKLSGVYGHASPNPELQARISIRNMPLQSLMSSGMARNITGEMTGKFDLQSRGISEKELIENLNGEGEVHVTDGALLGMQLDDTVTAVKKLFKQNESHERTNFSNMSLTFTVEDGTISNEDFYLHSEKAALKASGKIDLANRTINVRVRPQLETGVVDILVPVQISGPLSGPAVVPVVTTSTGQGAAIGAMLGGPVGASIGAVIGSKLSKDNVAPEAPEDPLTDAEIEQLEEKVQEGLENPLPFDLENVTPEDVRQFLNEE